MEASRLATRLARFGNSIFGEMSALAVRTGSINLGQGFPDTDGPAEVLEAAVAAVRAGHNQYPPAIGIAPLRQAIAAHQARFYGLAYDAETEVLVTAGATEAIAASIISLCGPGDEVIVFEPCYDSYGPCAAMVGARLRAVALRAEGGRFVFDPAELRAAVNRNTKAILLNTPHNPLGKVFTTAELDEIAAVCREHDLVAITDEVYEHLTFGVPHVPLAGRPGMRERTITISSAGKTFSFTGWKIGWACAPAPLVSAVRTVKQFLTYVNGAPFQPAVAVALALADDYYERFAAELATKRDRLATGLRAVGFDVFEPEGTYFITAGISALTELDCIEFCRWLPEHARVVAIPTKVFYESEVGGENLIRFAFCKRDEVLDEAVARLWAITPR